MEEASRKTKDRIFIVELKDGLDTMRFPCPIRIHILLRWCK